MKLTFTARVVALSALATPCLAQVTAPQAGSAAPKGSFAALIPLLKTMHSLSGSNLSPQERAQVTARMAIANRLDKAGMEALHLKNFAAAEDDYRQLIQVEPSSPYDYYGLGEALAGEGKTADALAAYRTAVDWPLNTAPEAVAISRAMGDTSNRRGCCGPADAVGWMKYALLLSQTGQNSKAFSVYSEAVRHAPDTAHPEISRSFEGRLPSPVEMQAAAHIALGLLVNDTGNDRELAMSEFEQARKLAPDAAVTNFYYAYGWKQLDLQSKTRLADAPQAKAALQKAALADDEDVEKAASEELRGLR